MHLYERLETLTGKWSTLAPRLREQLLPAADLQERLRAVGAPAHSSDIGLDWQRFKGTYTRAQMIRKRYTVLDVAFETKRRCQPVKATLSLSSLVNTSRGPRT